MTTFRAEQIGDETAVRVLNEQAFGQPNEANIVDALRERGAVVLSMVATDNDKLVGHVLFTEAIVTDAHSPFRALGLGPMAVLPSYQRRGIGSSLLRGALDECRELEYDAVVVIGHPEFYPRFGFGPAKLKGIRCEFDVPDDAFMVLELREDALAGRTGVVKYQPEFLEI
ncbi:MAG TPA: N-acetyltransferase [Sedimentisphaerales bacterium]|nr:N-acetyltransferase [Sedimentisphaerales bacterium]